MTALSDQFSVPGTYFEDRSLDWWDSRGVIAALDTQEASLKHFNPETISEIIDPAGLFKAGNEPRTPHFWQEFATVIRTGWFIKGMEVL